MIKTLQTTLKQDKERFKVPRSVQDIIPIRRLWPDGIFLNDPTQFEQVDETCGSGRVVLHLKSLGMTVFFEDIIPKRI